MFDNREYHRNYYYKRDPAKLKQYRDKYNKKIKRRKYNREYQRNHREIAKNWYQRNREKLLDRLNFEYRSKKLKEYVDSVEKLNL